MLKPAATRLACCRPVGIVGCVASSIVWKLTLFVGVLVELIGGALIAVAYFATSGDPARPDPRAADDGRRRPAEDAGDTLRQHEERATRFARRNRIHELLLHRAERDDLGRAIFGTRPTLSSRPR